MAVVKRYNLRGMATKIDDLYKDPEYATDTLNVYKDCSGRIIGRRGTLKYKTLATDDMYYSREKQEHYSFTNKLQVSADGITFTDVNKGFGSSAVINNSVKSIAEISGSIFFSDTELVDPVMKYNGFEYYQAGLPELTPNVVAFSTTGSGSSFSGEYYVAVVMAYYGVNGEQYFGEMITDKVTLSSNYPSITIDSIASINTARNTKYYDRQIGSGIFTTTAGIITSSAVNVQTTLVAGDYIKLLKVEYGYTESFYKKIKTVTNGTVSSVLTIELEDTSISGASYFVTTDTRLQANFYTAKIYESERQKYCAYIFMSKTDESDYRLMSQYDMCSFQYLHAAASDAALLAMPSISEYIDIADTRSQPFMCKYIASFANTLFCMNVFDDSVEKLSAKTLEYSIFFSSSNAGCSNETFNYSDNIIIGSPDEGGIIGAAPVDNNIVILKDRATYLLTLAADGTPGRLIKLSATVGCVSNRSIANFDNSCAWLSDKGIFAQSGSREPVELTEQIENIFTDNPYSLNFNSSRVAIDRFNELLMFYIPHTTTSTLDRVLVFSFKFKEWFWFMGIDGSNGFYHTGETVYFNDSANMYKIDMASDNDCVVDGAVWETLPSAVGLNGKVYFVEKTDKFYKSNNVIWTEQASPDNKTAIQHYYKSGWESLGNAAYEKKFNNVLVFSVQNPSVPVAYKEWKLKLNSDYDWDSFTDVQCDSEKQFLSTNRRNLFNVDKTACYARRFTFKNDNLSEGFELSGYEMEIMQAQLRIRD